MASVAVAVAAPASGARSRAPGVVAAEVPAAAKPGSNPVVGSGPSVLGFQPSVASKGVERSPTAPLTKPPTSTLRDIEHILPYSKAIEGQTSQVTKRLGKLAPIIDASQRKPTLAASEINKAGLSQAEAGRITVEVVTRSGRETGGVVSRADGSKIVTGVQRGPNGHVMHISPTGKATLWMANTDFVFANGKNNPLHGPVRFRLEKK